MLELLGQPNHIILWEQRLNVSRFRGITPDDLNGRFLFECPWNLIARENHGKLAIWVPHPFRKSALGMGIGPINFIQNQTQGRLIVANQR
jgi:hypothetical protein